MPAIKGFAGMARSYNPHIQNNGCDDSAGRCCKSSSESGTAPSSESHAHGITVYFFRSAIFCSLSG